MHEVIKINLTRFLLIHYHISYYIATWRGLGAKFFSDCNYLCTIKQFLPYFQLIFTLFLNIEEIDHDFRAACIDFIKLINMIVVDAIDSIRQSITIITLVRLFYISIIQGLSSLFSRRESRVSGFTCRFHSLARLNTHFRVKDFFFFRNHDLIISFVIYIQIGFPTLLSTRETSNPFFCSVTQLIELHDHFKISTSQEVIVTIHIART